MIHDCYNILKKSKGLSDTDTRFLVTEFYNYMSLPKSNGRFTKSNNTY